MAKILIAEDEDDIRELIALTLRMDGHEVLAVKDGRQAYEQTLIASPDLVLMDVRMPKMTGLQVCRRLKGRNDTRDIPVVFLSAKGRKAEIEVGMEAGAAAYILKPFSIPKLTAQVNKILKTAGN